MGRFYFKAYSVQQQFEGRYISNAASAVTIMTCIPFVRTCMNIAHVHTCVTVDPLPCSEILRAMFIGIICQKVRRHL